MTHRIYYVVEITKLSPPSQGTLTLVLFNMEVTRLGSRMPSNIIGVNSLRFGGFQIIILISQTIFVYKMNFACNYLIVYNKK